MTYDELVEDLRGETFYMSDDLDTKLSPELLTIEFKLTIIEPKAFLQYQGINEDSEMEDYFNADWFVTGFQDNFDYDLEIGGIGLESEVLNLK